MRKLKESVQDLLQYTYMYHVYYNVLRRMESSSTHPAGLRANQTFSPQND